MVPADWEVREAIAWEDIPRSRTEQRGDDEVDAALEALGVPRKDTRCMVELIARHGPSTVPTDASSLRTWMERVRSALASAPAR